MKLIQTLVTVGALIFTFNVCADPVNINTANAENIAENLKGIGAKKADAIVKFRKDNGKFKAIEELDQVKGIGAKTIEKNRADILLSAAKKK